jgi:2-C-methyl-D-erythritol 4-phosphate cytidylyltransferase
MTRTVAIVPAAGSGKRLGVRTKKPFVLLKGRPLVTYALKALSSSKHIDGIIVAADRGSVGRLKGLIKRYRIKKVIAVVAGGKTRLGSVKNCLERAGNLFDIALIHDGARPLVSEREISGSIRLARKYGACVTAIPEVDTVKLAAKDMFVKKTLDRSVMYRAQTPQAFRFEIIKKAYCREGRPEATDDSALAEGIGRKVKILEGSFRNIKVTTKVDLKLAEVLL